MKNTRLGSALLAVLFSMIVISTFVGIIYSVTNHNARITWRASNRLAAHAYADGVLESLYDQWRNAMITVTDSTDRSGGLSTSALAAKLSLPSNSNLPLPPNVTLVSWSVKASDPMLAPVSPDTNRPVPENGTNSSLRVRLYYVAQVTMTYAGPTGPSSTTVQRIFVRAGRNLFDNFFFGTQPITEFHPGAPMYVDGTVYVGGDLYTAHNDLHFLKDVTYIGSQTLNYKGTSTSDPLRDPRYNNAPTITNSGLSDNWDTNNPPHVGTEQKLLDTPRTSLDPRFLDDPTSNDNSPTNPDGTTADTNPNNDGYHEMIEEKVSGYSDPLQIDDPNSTSTSAASERLAANADYRIAVDASNNVSVYRGTGTTALNPATHPDAAAIIGAITTNTAIKDVRDGDNVRLVSVDVSKITGAGSVLQDTVGGGDGLLLYVKDTSVGSSVTTKVVDTVSGAKVQDVTSSRSRGVRLYNGSKLPANGLTVVSPNPVYIQGDYNSGRSVSGTSTTEPPSNTATSYTPPNDKPSPVVSGFGRAISAVVGDAVNILSNGWNDANSVNGNARNANNTTINTCIVAGNVPSTASSYSGGIENFIRFHENWSGDYLTIYGSLAQLYSSQQATRPWSAADYSPPNRRWYYDDKLQDSNPPGFHVARVYERGRWIAR